MKKKTVITTETREVWVIRPQLDSGQESGEESNDEALRPSADPQGSNRALAVTAEPGDPPHLESE